MKRLWPSIKQLPPWCLEKEMAIHSSILAREIPWIGEAGGLLSMGSQRVRHNWAHMPHGDISEHGAVWVPQFSSVQFSCSVVSDSLWPRGLHHARPPCPSPTPELSQTHVHWVSDAIQPSHPLSSPSPPALNLSQHQGLFQWVSSLHQVTTVLEFQLQHQSFKWIFRTDFLEDGLVWSP